MEKRDARLFLHEASLEPVSRNIVELESQRNLHHQVNELIRIAISSNLATHDIRQLLHLNSSSFGGRFATQLVRALQREDEEERQAVVWLLTVLDDPQTIPQLQHLALNRNLARATRLAASLALAGMGATREMIAEPGMRAWTLLVKYQPPALSPGHFLKAQGKEPLVAALTE
jgi:hypothetical protein